MVGMCVCTLVQSRAKTNNKSCKTPICKSLLTEEEHFFMMRYLVLTTEERSVISLQKSWLLSFLTATVPGKATACPAFCSLKYNVKDQLYLYGE